MSSVLTRRHTLLGTATLSLTAGLSGLLLPNSAFACHNYEGPSGRGCGAFRRDQRNNTSSQQSSSPSSSSSSEPRVSGRVVRVSNGSQLQSALGNVSAGTTIECANGNYRGGRFRITTNGTKSNPIMITSSRRLRAVLRENLEIRGDHVIVSGLSFIGAGVELRAHNCRVTRCYFSESHTAIAIRGANNAIIDHNEITKFRSQGINFHPMSEGRVGLRPHIFRNYCHSGADLNKNAAIHVGQQSNHHGYRVNGIVEFNLCENNTRRYKTIFCKSSENIVRYNTVINSHGIENRHGFGNKYVGNWLEDCQAFVVSDENCYVEGNRLVKVRLGIRVMAGTISSQQVPNQGGGVPFSDRCQLIDNDVDTQLQIGSVYRNWNRSRVLPARDTVVRGHKGRIILLTERITRIASTDQSRAGRAAVKLRPNQVGPNSA